MFEKKLDVLAATGPEVHLSAIGLQQEQIIDHLQARFTMIIGMEKDTPAERRGKFEYGMGDASAPSLEKFGIPWTVGRLRAVMVDLEKREYPDL